MLRRAVLTALLLAVLLAAAAGCRPADPTRVRLVSSLPRTGSAKQQTDAFVRGIRMAFLEIIRAFPDVAIALLRVQTERFMRIEQQLRASMRDPGP